MEKYKICIISEEAYPYFLGKGKGGSELQMTMLATHLVKKGHEIHFITFDKLAKKYEKINNIHVHNPYFNQKKGWTHLIPYNLLRYIILLKQIDADLYLQRAGPFTTSLIRILNKIYIFSVSDNASVSSNLEFNNIKKLKFIFHKINIKLSNCVFCQTIQQKKLLRKHGFKKGIVIRNMAIKSSSSPIKRNKTILWVGRIIKLKSPEKFLILAKELPEYHFQMIGGLSYGDEDYYEYIKEKSNEIKNLEFLGSIPRVEIYEYYSKASLFINTSSSEGFPNTFLESWSNETPIVSLNFDPDNIISNNNLGYHAENIEELVKYTDKLMKEENLNEIGKNCLNYVIKEHSIDEVIVKYENAFKKVIESSR